MNKQLHRLDLNLLVILQYLMEERSVSLAAKRLAITPSSVSKSEQIKNSILEFVNP